MKKLLQFFKNIFSYNEQKKIEDYLSQSSDIFELESRVREISRKKFN